MADDKQARDDQAHREEERQRERMMEDAQTRADEEEPVDPGGRLGDLDAALDDHDYPTTTEELVEAFGEYTIEIQRGEETLEAVLASTDNQQFDSADDVRRRILGLIHR